MTGSGYLKKSPTLLSSAHSEILFWHVIKEPASSEWRSFLGNWTPQAAGRLFYQFILHSKVIFLKRCQVLCPEAQKSQVPFIWPSRAWEHPCCDCGNVTIILPPGDCPAATSPHIPSTDFQHLCQVKTGLFFHLHCKINPLHSKAQNTPKSNLYNQNAQYNLHDNIWTVTLRT